MADAKVMSEQTLIGQFPTFDFEVVDGIVPFVEGIEADSQAAGLSAFIDKGSIPQLPGIGVPWEGFLVNEVQFAEVDSTIRYNLQIASLPFRPTYDIVNGQLVCTVVKQ